MNKSKYNHLESVHHKILDESIVSRYIIFKPFINENDEKVKRCFNIFKKISTKFGQLCIKTNNY